jgi:hypothetical protein
VWGAGFQLELAATAVPEPDTPACVVADARPDARPSRRTGVLLRGTLDSTLRFHPTRAVWWEGFDQGSGPVQEATTASGITLPD